METPNEKKQKPVVSVGSMSLDISKPMTLKVPEMELRMVNLICGPNGTGKSFINVFTYFASKIGILLSNGMTELPTEALIEACQWTLDRCYSNHEITGTVLSRFNKDCSIEFSMDQGKMIGVQHHGFSDVIVSGVRYMSTTTRTFDAIKSYHVMRSLLMRLHDNSWGLALEEMLKTYKLYDLEFIEDLRESMPKDVTGEDRVRLQAKSMVSDKVISFGYDDVENDFYAIIEKDEDKVKRFLTTYGKGEQSIFCMTIPMI